MHNVNRKYFHSLFISILPLLKPLQIHKLHVSYRRSPDTSPYGSQPVAFMQKIAHLFHIYQVPGVFSAPQPLLGDQYCSQVLLSDHCTTPTHHCNPLGH